MAYTKLHTLHSSVISSHCSVIDPSGWGYHGSSRGFTDGALLLVSFKGRREGRGIRTSYHGGSKLTGDALLLLMSFKDSKGFLHPIMQSILRLKEVEDICVVQLQEHPGDLPSKVHVVELGVDVNDAQVEAFTKVLFLFLLSHGSEVGE